MTMTDPKPTADPMDRIAEAGAPEPPEPTLQDLADQAAAEVREAADEFDAPHALSLISNAEAAEVALFPERSELEALASLAVTLAASNLVPKDLRKRPNDVLVVLLTARELGIHYMTAIRGCVPVDGNVTIVPKLKLALVRSKNLGRVWFDKANDAASATVYAIRHDDPGETHAYTVDWSDVQQAQLAGKACTSGSDHADGVACKCKHNYKTYPKNMLKWRACGYLLDEIFGEVGTGLYSPEELGAIVTDEGNAVIDVSGAVSLVPTRGSDDAPLPPIDDDLRARLESTLAALPEAAKDPLRNLWSERIGRIAPPNLTAGQGKIASALVESFVKRAAAGEWGTWADWTWAQSDPSAKVTPADFEEGTGKSPHDLARDRAARQKAAATAPPEGHEDAPTAPESAAAGTVTDTPDSAPEGQDGGGDGQGDPPDPDDETRATCIGCDKPVKTTADGRNHPGPNGRAGSPYRSYHRSCAPFD